MFDNEQLQFDTSPQAAEIAHVFNSLELVTNLQIDNAEIHRKACSLENVASENPKTLDTTQPQSSFV